jgi:TonB family protein
VVVKVTVDKNGLVKNAEAGVRGSNTADPDLIAAARRAALQARFNVDSNAPDVQTGTITYRFVLD